tara:strand:+ start:3403 stop:3540 length:138 start_codon:yes stop_codon:yes gene_type:complete
MVKNKNHYIRFLADRHDCGMDGMLTIMTAMLAMMSSNLRLFLALP